MKMGVKVAYSARVRERLVNACQTSAYDLGLTTLSTRWAPLSAHEGLADAAEYAVHQAARDQVMWKREMPDLSRA